MRRPRRFRATLGPRPMSGSMSGSHIHTVVNEAPTAATSVHVYSPPLVSIRHYDESPEMGTPLPGYREIVDHGTLRTRDPIDR
jgi:hypothetical protein